MSTDPSFGGILQEYFSQRLAAQRDASAATIASYRDTFRLLLRYVQEVHRKQPVDLSLADLDGPLILGFLDHLEHQRHNGVRTRNARLAAIRSFLHFAALKSPTSLPSIRRVLAIPVKRFDRPVLGFLSREEVTAILDAPDRTTWSGRRDHAFLTTLYNTGARVSEILGAVASDIDSARRCVELRGKGRKARVVPLWPSTSRLLGTWIREASIGAESPVFPNSHGTRMSRSGAENRLACAVAAASTVCPTLKKRSISPHTFRHTTAMHLLQAGVDITVIALSLGHESPSTTHVYIEADLAMKKKVLDKLAAPAVKKNRFRPTDAVLAFLDGL
jgi:site-specific recombinase XerD